MGSNCIFVMKAGKEDTTETRSCRLECQSFRQISTSPNMAMMVQLLVLASLPRLGFFSLLAMGGVRGL